MGFLYAANLQAEGSWVYRPGLGWTFLSAWHPGFIYSVERRDWIYEVAEPRQFYDITAQKWFHP